MFAETTFFLLFILILYIILIKIDSQNQQINELKTLFKTQQNLQTQKINELVENHNMYTLSIVRHELSKGESGIGGGYRWGYRFLKSINDLTKHYKTIEDLTEIVNEPTKGAQKPDKYNIDTGSTKLTPRQRCGRHHPQLSSPKTLIQCYDWAVEVGAHAFSYRGDANTWCRLCSFDEARLKVAQTNWDMYVFTSA